MYAFIVQIFADVIVCPLLGIYVAGRNVLIFLLTRESCEPLKNETRMLYVMYTFYAD